MDWDYLPDYLNNEDSGNNQCMTRSGGSNDCQAGDPIWYTGGAFGTNGVAYDPRVFYKPALKADGTTVSASPLSVTSVPVDAFQAQSTSTIDITASIQDNKFCNSNSVCKRNGATGDNTTLTAANGKDGQGNTIPNAGQFPYRTHLTNSSTAIFGLPEMMAMGQFARSGSTVTATTLAPHGLTTSDRIWVDSTNNNFDAVCVAINSVTASTFTYTAGSSGTIGSTLGSFRKCYNAVTFVRDTLLTFVGLPTSLTRVTTTAHGLQTGDVITTTGNAAGDSTLNLTNVPITVLDADHFTFNTTSSTARNTTGHWVRTGLYNQRGTVNGAAIAYTITPVEYCSDANLTNCAQVLPGNTPPSGFTFPAYLRFCQTAEQALAPDAIGDASGTPRCRSKYIGYGASPSWKFGRYGWFAKENIISGAAPFKNRPNRADCTTSGTAPDCTYAEEIQNYARWFTYYRTRMQMMKTTAGRAFLPLISTGSANDKLRVGFITINPTYNNASGSSDHGTVQSSKYLKIDTFRGGSGNQADNWFTKFYAQIPDQSTPLREALSRAGWIYAGKLNTGLTDGIPTADDPVIASCQRHFTLLTTDGYWNGNGPQDLNGNAIGTTDSVNPQTDTPYTTVAVDRTSTGTFDGAAASSTTTSTPTTQDKQVVCEGNLQTNFAGGGDTACGCGITQHRVMDRTTVTTQNVTVGGGSPGTTTTSNTTFAPAAAPDGTCSQGTYTTSIQHQTVKQSIVCDRRNNNNNPVSFPNGGTASCNNCATSSSGARYVLIRQTATQDKTTTTVDGFQTDLSTAFTNVASSTYEYSKDGGSNWTTTVPASSSACSTSNNGASGPTPTNNGSPVAGASGSGTSLALISPNPSAPVVGTPLVNVAVAGGYDDTLADVAMYYYRSDLRGGKDTKGNSTGPALNAAGVDVSANNVPVTSGSKNYAAHQAMVTFTVGLADGNLRYQSDYDSSTTGDFANIKSGTPNACFWSSGTCNWPEPIHDTPAALDDLWHAAVNGRGQFYLATNVDALASGIQNTLTAVNAQVAAAAASATSSPNVTQTDNQIFSTTYETNTWAGRVFAQTIDPATGNVDPTIQWQGDQLLLGRVTATTDTRTILTFDPAGTNKVKSFTFASLNSTEQAFFTHKCDTNIGSTLYPVALLSQCTSVTGAQQTTINAGTTLVDFLRGQTGNESSPGSTSPLYRDRTVIDPATGAVTQTIMGDTISAKPNYVRAPIFDYGGTYSSFITAQASRAPRVYVGANDGYLHAFDGVTGAESWAYVPRFLMPMMSVLADRTYSTTHTYFVEGSPEVNDVFDATASAWKTVLVGGAAGGGRGYYALDVTDPASPKVLWEWCADANQCDPTTADVDIGLTYGNPVFGKRAYDGRWVVVFTSGLNNNLTIGGSTGSGKGTFWVVDAITGALLNKVSTGVGTVTTPSGLMKQAPYYTNGGKIDATFQYIYAGDQLGNVWRLDVGLPPVLPATVTTPAPVVITKITTLKDASGRAQPITSRPIPSIIGTDYVLFIGTGRYLGTPDLSDQGAGASSWQQSYYAFKDKAYSAGVQGSLRTDTALVQRTFTQVSPTERGISNSPVVTMNWNTNDGWFIDFNPVFSGIQDSPGEGINLVDPRLINGTVFATTNVPANTAGGAVCAVGGSSFQYQFDFRSGLPISTSPNGAVGWANQKTITVGVAVVQLPNGAIKAITTGADTTKTTSSVNTNASGTIVKRFSYRVR
jgi:type IV pilus assembly protein PilY1